MLVCQFRHIPGASLATQRQSLAIILCGHIMSDDPFSPATNAPERPPEATPGATVTTRPESRLRQWVARAGIIVITILALGLPLLFGLAFYLFLSEEIVINAGDPIREARIWTIREGRSLTGLAWSLSSPERPATGETTESIQCARMRVRYLKWDDSLRFEPDSEYCRCYERRGNGWTNAPVACRVE